MNRIRTAALATVTAAALALGGCAGWWNKVARDGGIFGQYDGDWIAVKYSNGKIMDVWRLRNQMVQSEEHSDGWLFQDDAGNPVNIGGDVKLVRVNDHATWDRYHDYHFDLEGGAYVPGNHQ